MRLAWNAAGRRVAWPNVRVNPDLRRQALVRPGGDDGTAVPQPGLTSACRSGSGVERVVRPHCLHDNSVVSAALGAGGHQDALNLLARVASCLALMIEPVDLASVAGWKFLVERPRRLVLLELTRFRLLTAPGTPSARRTPF